LAKTEKQRGYVRRNLGRDSYNGLHLLSFLCFFFNLDFLPVLNESETRFEKAGV